MGLVKSIKKQRMGILKMLLVKHQIISLALQGTLR